jgi:MFS transporter, SP family, galactose:H+ symporter
MKKKKKHNFSAYSLMAALIAAIGGLLFGYNTAVVSGAMLFITKDMNLTILDKEVVVSTILIGALIGAWIGGVASDKFGRRYTLFITSVLFVVGVLFLYFSDGMTMLLIGRFVVGLGIGIASLTVPLYISEMSPSKVRGTFVSFNQLAITIGILASYGVDLFFSRTGDWHAMFGIAIFPSIALFIGLLFIPETPSWLAEYGFKNKAKKVLAKIHRNEKEEAIIISKQKDTEKVVSWRNLLHKSVRAPLIVGVLISVFQQVTGVNTVFYYAPEIFKMSGFYSDSVALMATVGLGIVNVIMTIVALWLIDVIGRRLLLIIGTAGMVVSLVALSLSFYIGHDSVSYVAVISLMAYVSFFAIGLGPVAWLIISEIFPLGVRGRAMGVAVFANWVFNYIVSLTFLSLIAYLGKDGTFLLYAVIGVLALWFIIVKVPETKGKSLQEIQKFWKKSAKKG